MRRLLLLLVAAALLPHAGAAGDADPIKIAVIDTGIDASHPEFAPGQIVAWKDFTAEASPTPKDGHGHGTATASLVAGINANDCGTGLGNRKLAFAPGAPLIIARVGTDGGAVTGSIVQAMDWAVAQGADVISMSIGAVVPVPSVGSAAVARAREAGVLVVVSAGNGLQNAGTAPYPSWMSAYGENEEALVVGGADENGQAILSLTGNSDPDVVSWSDGVCVARANTKSYTHMSGTSFSAPLVAGMAGGLAQRAKDAGQPHDADRVEALLSLGAANNPIVPYHREGLGSLMPTQYNRLTTHAAAGTLPDYEAQGPWATADLAYHDAAHVALRR
jgi:subtilisin family serine protease